MPTENAVDAKRPRTLAAGAVYFAVVFAAGFALGAVRSLALTPHLGMLVAVLVELPVILTVAWIACGWAVARFDVPPRPATRLAMGAVAFSLLMAAELGLTIAMGQTTTAFFGHFATAPGAVGLGGQVVFGLLPVIRR